MPALKGGSCVYIGLDLGTSGVKSVLFDLQGNVLLRRYRSYSLVDIKDGLELNPEEVFRAVLEVLSGTAAGGYPIPVSDTHLACQSIGPNLV